MISNYGGTILLPGGSLEGEEELDKAIARELEEETGIKYNPNDLEYLTTIVFYQKNYPTRKNIKID